MTFSLLARCPETGHFGAVIATSGMAVGARCVHIRPGVGGVLSQHRTDPRLGPRGLDLLAAGLGAEAALAALAASSPAIAWRQLAVMDRTGASAVFHGDQIYSIRSDAAAPGVVAIGNIIDHPGVPGAMVAAFLADPKQAMCDRLLAAIEAGEAAGGETGAISSAQLVAYKDAPFAHVDLRVDWSETPLADLRALWRRYAPMADDLMRRALDPDSVPNIPALVEAARRRKAELGIA